MFRIRILSLLAAGCCLAGLAVTAEALEVESGSIYCFQPEDFSSQEALSGICITDLPEGSQFLLGSRVLQPGDVLTAQQLGQMTYASRESRTDATARLTYLPIVAGHAEDEAVMTLSIRGKEDKAPVAEDCALETYKNLELTGKLKASDPEGQALTFAVTRQPRRGNVEIREDGSFTYTPKKNKVGIDSFTYTATDPAGNVSREATVIVTLLKPTEATQYTDTLGQDCRFAAEWMKNTGIFVGEQISGNPCFRPDREVSRGEFVTMLVKTLDIPIEEALTHTGYGEDVPTWLQPYLAAALRAGLTAGLPDTETFGAEAAITGPEAAILLENALDREVILEQETLTRADAAQLLYDCAKELEG